MLQKGRDAGACRRGLRVDNRASVKRLYGAIIGVMHNGCEFIRLRPGREKNRAGQARAWRITA